MVNLLLVDDEPYLLMIYEEMFRLAGFNVVGHALNGQEAMDKFQDLNMEVDIVIMDHRMPVKDGVSTTKEMLNLKKDLKIVFVSADSTIEERAIEAGAVLFIGKPFSFDKLVEELKKLV